MGLFRSVAGYNVAQDTSVTVKNQVLEILEVRVNNRSLKISERDTLVRAIYAGSCSSDTDKRCVASCFQAHRTSPAHKATFLTKGIFSVPKK